MTSRRVHGAPAGWIYRPADGAAGFAAVGGAGADGTADDGTSVTGAVVGAALSEADGSGPAGGAESASEAGRETVMESGADGPRKIQKKAVHKSPTAAKPATQTSPVPVLDFHLIYTSPISCTLPVYHIRRFI